MSVDIFVKEMLYEHGRAVEKFPGPNPSLAALTEEVGELAQAILHVREGKISHWNLVINEAVQVAVMAMRCALEGDATLIPARPPSRFDLPAIGTPLSQLSGRPGHDGFEKFDDIAQSWGY